MIWLISKFCYASFSNPVILIASALSLDCSLDVTFQTYICCQFCNPKKVAFFTLSKKKETPVELKSLKQKESQFSVQQ